MCWMLLLVFVALVVVGIAVLWLLFGEPNLLVWLVWYGIMNAVVLLLVGVLLH